MSNPISLQELAAMPPIPMPTPGKPSTVAAAKPPASTGKAVMTHAVAAVAGVVMALGAPVVKDNWPITMPAPIEKKTEEKKAEPAPVVKPAPKVEPVPLPTIKPELSPYEIKVRAAVEVDPHSHPIFIKRLLYLYRDVLKNTLAGKSELAIRAAFEVEEKKLDLVNGLPILRPIIVDEWNARYPANAPAEVIRESNVRFWKETIAILERLP